MHTPGTAAVDIILDARIPFVVPDGAASGATPACDVMVHVLVGDVSRLMADEAVRHEAQQRLSDHRRAKVSAISHPRGQAQSIGAALLLDSLLSEVGLCERDMRYAVNEHGKPSLLLPEPSLLHGAAGMQPHFSLSHSGALAAAALAVLPPALSIGLDLQRVTRYRPELVRRVFTAADRQLLAAAADELSRQRLFTHLWCRAEAYAKATGEGLRWPFPEPPATARFADLDVGDDYRASLCLTVG